MCGIAGYLGDDEDFGRWFIQRANGCLGHRGPDDEGVYFQPGVALGHRRLAILDLSAAGHQPMLSPDGRWALVYNGEVYNHLELRRELSNRWEFKSQCDAETVLAALALQGPAALQKMVGMWALLLWDAHARRLLLARDRYGQKPLYWRKTQHGITLASEIRPLFLAEEKPASYHPALAEYMATGTYGHLGAHTFFRDVHKFPPAHWAWLKAGEAAPQLQRYWRFPVVAAKERRPYDETARRQFRAAFDEAVDSQLMADVPVGVTLSGGLDSSAIVGALAARGRKPITVFTAQAPGTPFDETPYVQAVADKWPGQLDIHYMRLERQPLSVTLPEMIVAQEEPFGDPSIIAHGLLMKAAQQAGVRVILGGQGADELLFGYPYLAHSWFAHNMRAGRVGWAWDEMRAGGVGAGVMARAGIAGVWPGLEQRLRCRSREKRRFWLSPALRRAGHRGNHEWAALSDTNAMWLEAIERVALPHLTHYDDRSGMLHSVEGRMPFLDHRLADIVAALPAEAFLHQGRSKRLLRDSCRELLPAVVLQRQDKIGFYTPMETMLREESSWVRGLLRDDYTRSLGWFDADLLVSYLDDLARNKPGNETMRLIWRAISARIWAEKFNIS